MQIARTNIMCVITKLLYDNLSRCTYCCTKLCVLGMGGFNVTEIWISEVDVTYPKLSFKFKYSLLELNICYQRPCFRIFRFVFSDHTILACTYISHRWVKLFKEESSIDLHRRAVSFGGARFQFSRIPF